LDFELNSRPSECQMKSSENLIDQFAALIDNGQENKKTMENKQLKSFKDPDV